MQRSEVNAYQIAHKMFCVQTWSSNTNIVEIITEINDKHQPLKTDDTSKTKKVKSGMDESRSINRQDRNSQSEEM